MKKERHTYTSEMRAPLLVNGAAANVPPSNLKMMIEAVFLDKAHPTWKPVYTMNVPMNRGLLPY